MSRQEKQREEEEKKKKMEETTQRRRDSSQKRDALKEGTTRRRKNTETRQKESRSQTRRNKIRGNIKQELSEIAEETMNISPSTSGGSSTIQPNETSGDDYVDELLNIIGSGIDKNIISDIKEKFDDIYVSYKYTVFRENEFGETIKHKYWIYLDDDTEEQMRHTKGAEKLHTPYMLKLGGGVNKKRLQGKKNKKFKKTRRKTAKRKKKRNGQNKRKKTKQQRIKN
tara:strand:- start:489 stop:1166 length:678 start_codon:yes stop_codon:yes gene_type:complete